MLKRIINRIPENEAARLAESGKTLIDPRCPPDRVYGLASDFIAGILIERGLQGYAVRETEKSIILFRPQ